MVHRTSSRRSVAGLLTAALCLVLAGCGGDEQGSGPGANYTVRASTTMTVASPRLDKAQFISRVNRICREAWATVIDNWHQYSKSQSSGLSEAERFEDAVKRSLLAGIDFHIFDSIRILGAPPGEQKAIEEIIGPFQRSVELGQQRYWRAQNADEVVANFQEYNRLARMYGLNDCLVDQSRLRNIDTRA